MPLFTIAIPAYKALYFGEAIESCLAQTFQDFELVIVDDASPEKLGEIVGRYNDTRIRYCRNERNCGAVNVVDNWNKCLEYANGQYIICMGDDDKLLPKCLELYNDLIAKYPNLNIFHAWTQIIDDKSQVFDLQESRPEWESALSAQYYRWQHRWKQYIGDYCFRVAHLRKEGGFFKLPLAWGSDDVTVFRAGLENGIANTQQFGFQYRKNPHTISNSGNQQLKASAHVKEWKWFAENLNMMECDNEQDKLFLSFLLRDIDEHYRQKIHDMLEEDLSLHSFNIRYWLENAASYNLSQSEVYQMAWHVIRKNKRIRF
ncbi:MAG: glycosyltransferase family 2 protein [Bacteroidales bacterium]|jgi:glycosyltransferase involved in cell wall biosynthesis|nr:glycosyltransferase family 2 protein [Bacteroidales bacterium]